MSRRRAILAAAAVLAVLSAGGCRPAASSVTLPYDRQVVWPVAMGQCLTWRPTIDERAMFIESRKVDLGDREIVSKLWVEPDYNWFVRRPSTRVVVSMRQVTPTAVRYTQAEQEFLGRLVDEIQARFGGP